MTTPLTVTAPLSAAFDFFKSSIPSLSRDDLLKTRRTLEQIECGVPTPTLGKIGKSAVENASVNDGTITFSLSSAFLTAAGFLYNMLASATPAERQATDAATFSHLSSAEESASANQPVVCRGDKSGIMEWLGAFAECATAEDVLACKSILMKHMVAKTVRKETDLLKISHVSMDVSADAIALKFVPKERKRVDFFASLLPSLTPKQMIAIDMKLSNALLNPVAESKSAPDVEHSNTGENSEATTPDQPSEAAPETTENAAVS